MRILVTGGGGFIGSALIRRLDPRFEVVCLDRGRHYDILRGMLGANVNLVKGDFADVQVVGEAMSGVDTMVHLGGVAGERRCLADPLKGVVSNVYGTHVLLDAARRAGVRRIIFASSYWVYSTFTPRRLPIREDSELETDSVYGAEKVASELMVQHSGIDHVILRIAGVYGYGTGLGSQSEGMMARFIQAALEGQPLQIYGDGQQCIDLVYVDDVVAVLQWLLDREWKESAVYNIGGGRAMSLLEIAGHVDSASRRESTRAVRLEFRPAPPGKVWPDKWLAIDRLQAVLPGYPFTPVDEGIAATFRDYAKGMER
jgi:UDP-glucose 4-epimerase